MKTFDSGIIIAGILFLLTIASGIWLTKSGRPLNTIIFTIHKLIALGTVVYTGIFVFNLLKTNGIGAAVIVLVVTAALLIIALFATGAFLSFEKPLPEYIKLIHKIASTLTVISLTAAIYLLK